VAKGLWREEITYAKSMIDQVVREQLMKMLTWQIGIKTRFSRNPGKLGKYFKQYLDPGQWDNLQKTYSDATLEHTWEALFAMGELFRAAAKFVGSHFQYEYPGGDDRRVSAHLEHVRSLPRSAGDMY
jgi:aminoglycoside 6-adenylyltransferase